MGKPVIRSAFRAWKHGRREARALAEIAARPEGGGQAHGLRSELVVSLTSYPARFDTLMPTLQAILRQTVRPDRVILWLAPEDIGELSPEIRALERLEIRGAPNFRSYTKIVPTLLAAPGAHIVTADDDCYYPIDWLERLVAAARDGAAIACLRAHKVVMAGPGQPAPYEEWQHNLAAPARGPHVFLTGVSGVIYAPDVFHSDVTRDDLFTRLAPSADDVWLYFMHRLAGVEAQKIGGRARILEWSGSQAGNLRTANRQNSGNDAAIAAMIGHYGWP